MTTPERNLFSPRTLTPSATTILRHAPAPPRAEMLAKTSSMSRVEGCVLGAEGRRGGGGARATTEGQDGGEGTEGGGRTDGVGCTAAADGRTRRRRFARGDADGVCGRAHRTGEVVRTTVRRSRSSAARASRGAVASSAAAIAPPARGGVPRACFVSGRDEFQARVRAPHRSYGPRELIEVCRAEFSDDDARLDVLSSARRGALGALVGRAPWRRAPAVCSACSRSRRW